MLNDINEKEYTEDIKLHLENMEGRENKATHQRTIRISPSNYGSKQKYAHLLDITIFLQA